MLFNARQLRRLRARKRRIVAILLLLLVVDTLLLISGRPAKHRTPAWAGLETAATRNVTVFIASVHRNTEKTLLAVWNKAVLRLVDHIGAPNVHFSAIESGSQDGTKDALKELKQGLDAAGVSNTINLGMTVWEQVQMQEDRPSPDKPRVPGWIWNEQERYYDRRRIPYLADVRNQALQPLQELEAGGRHFDKILWINDVAFGTEDFLALLATRGGNYAAACSMDFSRYPYYYDTFALRDEQGHKTASQYWPWFRSSVARGAVRRGNPVRVFSCWNGMVVFDAAPFYARPPLRFRGVADSLADLHLEASECCLIHADNAAAISGDPAGRGVWLNPNVRVGYSVEAYRDVAASVVDRFPGLAVTVVGAWKNRAMRLWTMVQHELEDRVVRERVKRWKAETPGGQPMRNEVGVPCLINEMQIMWQNGWKHL